MESSQGVDFESFGLSEATLRAIRNKGYTVSTPVQAGCIPPMMAGRDVIAKAPTGTGKTCAFGIPVAEHIDPALKAPQAVILAPTRELAQQIADSLGVELEVVDMAFDGIIPAVQSGQVDLGIAAFTNTPERAEEIDFSDLYETSAQLLIVKAGNADTYSTKESLVGLKVGAQKGTIQSQLIQSALPESELFELEKYPALALEVQNGNIAGLVVDQAVGEALVASSNGALEVSNFTFTAEEASFGKSVVIAKGNEDLVAVVNEVINKVTADGSYQKAYDEAVELAASLGL